jgi:hypothetical protein
MTNANTNTGNLNPFLHPAAHYASPEDVLNDDELSVPEKRIILSSWASDMFAVESCPALREIPGMGHTIRLADILAALRRLDGDDDPPRPGGVPCGCGGPAPPRSGGPHDAHAGCRDGGSAGACFGDVGRSVDCFMSELGTGPRSERR